MFWWAISQTSITDRSSEASSSSCSRGLRPTRMPCDSAESLKRLFSSNCNAELSYCGNKRLSQAVTFSPETAGSVQHSTAVPTYSHRVNKNHFNCYLCSFSCSWAFDLSLHLRKKHGVHKKLWAFAKLRTLNSRDGEAALRCHPRSITRDNPSLHTSPQYWLLFDAR